MNRQIAYPGQLLPETLLLGLAKDSMVGLGWLAQAVLGTSMQVAGLDCVPTAPASMQVVVRPGVIFTQAATDTAAFSSLAADSNLLVKQGLFLTATNFSCPAPGTAGQSINYLIQATFQEVDGGAAVLPYYNSANPSSPFSGVGGGGLSQPTVRNNNCVVSVKAGAAATTGTQTTPSPDAGYVGLWVVTVANGATTITGGSISKASGAPFISNLLTLQAMAGLPIGMPGYWTGATPPYGFLKRNGAVVPQATYPELYDVIGTTFNTGGEGAGNFRLPEARGESDIGWDDGRGIDSGRTLGSWQKGSLLVSNENTDNQVHGFANLSAGGARAGLGWGTPNMSDYSGTGSFIGATTPEPGGGLFASSHYGVARTRSVAYLPIIRAF